MARPERSSYQIRVTSTIRMAGPDDLEPLLERVQAFWLFEKLPFEAAWVRRSLATLLAQPAYGAVFLAEQDADRPAIVGYLVLAFGFSLEHGGRDALVDELYVQPAFRGAGIGSRLLAAADTQCRALGIARVHLEVDNTNPRAAQLYQRLGFASNDRRLLTKALT